jgi:glycine/D-amino acid oxidase-like deaminating enzyme
MSPGFRGGRWLPGGALVHPARLLYGLALDGPNRRADRHLRAVPAGGRVVVRTTRGTVAARAAVVACGAASGALLPGLATVLRPVRGQVLATAPVAPVFGPGMAVDWGTAYWRQAPDGAIVLGGLGGHDPEAERTNRAVVNWRIQSALRRFLPEAFPGLSRIHVARRWAGIMDVTPDGAPIVGPWPGGSPTWVVAGFGGHGLPPALGAGRMVARSIATGRLDEDLRRLDPGRFRC